MCLNISFSSFIHGTATKPREYQSKNAFGMDENEMQWVSLLRYIFEGQRSRFTIISLRWTNSESFRVKETAKKLARILHLVAECVGASNSLQGVVNKSQAQKS
jgi:hypothetical protein